MSAGIVSVLRLVDRILKSLIPASEQRIGYLSHPDCSDNAYYMFLHLLRARIDLEHVWLINSADSAERIKRDFMEITQDAPGRRHRLQVVRKNSLLGYFSYLRCGTVFYSHGLYRFSDAAYRRNIVCLWHGMPIKAIGALDPATRNQRPPFGSLHVATSHFFRYVIAQAFRVQPESVKVCGLPRNDALRYADARRHDGMAVRRRLGISDGERLILWLPTFRGRPRRPGADERRSFLEDLPQEALAALIQKIRDTNGRLVAKLHPQDVLNDRADLVSDDRMRIIRAGEWAHAGLQLYDVLAVADGLISDVSSVIVDFLATGRPIGILGFDPQTYDRQLTFPPSLLLRSSRAHDLQTPEGQASFVEALYARPRAMPDDDLCVALHEPGLPRSAEYIAATIGL